MKLRFSVNPYNPFVANKTVNRQKYTIVWHVNYLKFPHTYPEKVTKMLNHMEEKFGKMIISCGKKHEYLGLELDYNTSGEVKMTMVPYLRKFIEDVLEEIRGRSESLAVDHLF